ncbi:SYCP1 protein, partial [Atractosteus spatula]|nr:SYCP1 protein [Atractosteus spatula]
IKKLKSAVDEALKNKQETEITCQHKISEMVTLMEKHKNQYDKNVEEKEAEFHQKKRKEIELITAKTSLEQELSKLKVEFSNLKQQLNSEMKEKKTDPQDLSSTASTSTKETPSQKSAKNSVSEILRKAEIKYSSTKHLSWTPVKKVKNLSTPDIKNFPREIDSFKSLYSSDAHALHLCGEEFKMVCFYYIKLLLNTITY